MPDDNRIPTDALEAIGELLTAAAQHGIGVAFEPDGEGWRISHILHDWPAYNDYNLPAGELANTYDLEVGAKAALKPLVELGERASQYFASRDGR